MPIIINNFEIIAEPPRGGDEGRSGSSDGAAAQSAAVPAQLLRPEEIARAVRVHRERNRRVTAD